MAANRFTAKTHRNNGFSFRPWAAAAAGGTRRSIQQKATDNKVDCKRALCGMVAGLKPEGCNKLVVILVNDADLVLVIMSVRRILMCA